MGALPGLPPGIADEIAASLASVNATGEANAMATVVSTEGNIAGITETAIGQAGGAEAAGSQNLANLGAYQVLSKFSGIIGRDLFVK